MKKNPFFVAFSTQKGGIGKTVSTVLISSYLHYLKGYKIGVIDCDFPQHSINGMRKREGIYIMKDDYYKSIAYSQFDKSNIKAYPIEMSTGEDAVGVAKKMIQESDEGFDFIFFDLPGTLNSGGIINTLASMDYIFSPISADRLVLESTLEFASMLNDNIITQGKGNIKGLYLFWTLVDAHERTNLYEAYKGVISELGLQLLDTYIPDRKCFRHEMDNSHKPIFRSTFFAADKLLIKSSRLDNLADEIIEIIKPNKV